MSLSGKEELHRTLGIVDCGGKLLDIGKNQVGAFVGRETTGKANRQRIGGQDFAQPLQSFCRLATAFYLLAGAAADKLNQLRLERQMGFP
jgi:hypothetical protein